MYHILNDKRSKDSAEKIYQSLRHILFNKKLEDITITDIQKESGISRSTFYRCFDNIIDVLEMKLFYFVDKYFLESQNSNNKLLFFYKYWDKHSGLIYLLSTQNESILKSVMRKHYEEKLNALNEPYFEYLLELKISILSSLLCKWVDRNKKESPEEMAILTKKILDNNNYKLLTEF